MSEADELKDSVNKEVKAYDEFLKWTKDIVELVPSIQERKREAEVKKLVLTKMPKDILTENAPKLLPIQRNIQRKFEAPLSTLSQLYDELKTLPSTGTSLFLEAVVTSESDTAHAAEWVQPIIQEFESLADEKAKKADLPIALEALNNGLGDGFRAAVESVEKSMGGILGADQAAKRLRDVIEKLWGGLVNLARNKCQKNFRGGHFELKRKVHRIEIGNCIVRPPENEALIAILDGLCELHSNISDVFKDPLYNDLLSLKKFYTRWLLHIADLCKLIAL